MPTAENSKCDAQNLKNWFDGLFRLVPLGAQSNKQKYRCEAGLNRKRIKWQFTGVFKLTAKVRHKTITVSETSKEK